MNERQLQIIDEARKVVSSLFQAKVNPLFVFHNLEHTRHVVTATEEIEAHYQLDNNDQFVLSVSAWFHDTGFSTGVAEEHEQESIKLATDFLYQQHVHPEVILQIASCIRATHMPQQPVNLVEKIICDADLFHLGSNSFMERNELLRKEHQAYYKIDFPEAEWRKLNIEFLKSHNYFTGYCRKELEPVKQEWIEKLQSNQKTSVK
jgi:predicted metal-dependent HD superfamily phosphohydrolase